MDSQCAVFWRACILRNSYLSTVQDCCWKFVLPQTSLGLHPDWTQQNGQHVIKACSACGLQVRHLLHSEDMVSSLAAHGVKPDDVLGSLLGPWGASSPQTDLKRHEMEKLISSASADSSETRTVKQELERLLSAQLPNDESANAKSDVGSSDSTTDAADAT